MAKVKYFSELDGQTVELTAISAMDNRSFAALFPGVNGKRFDSYAMKVGRPIYEEPVWSGEKWISTVLPVQRIVFYKLSPSKHECDTRCVNANGRTMNCECACGGVNHGRGSFICEAA
jgi:hypothetical protein